MATARGGASSRLLRFWAKAPKTNSEMGTTCLARVDRLPRRRARNQSVQVQPNLSARFRAPKQTSDPLLQIIQITSPGQQCPRPFQNRHVPLRRESRQSTNTSAKLQL